ncbi:MAG: hypothetical protein QXL96_01910 [Ignisphaera sp.]
MLTTVFIFNSLYFSLTIEISTDGVSLHELEVCYVTSSLSLASVTNNYIELLKVIPFLHILGVAR